MKNCFVAGRLQLHKSRFTTAQFDFTTAHFLINCTIKYALGASTSTYPENLGAGVYSPQSYGAEFVMSPLRRHIFVCFMAKSAFFFWGGGGGFGPSSVHRGRTHDEIWMKYVVCPPPLHTLKIRGAGVNSKRSYGAEFVVFYQRVSIASYASAGITRGGMSVCPSVCPSVRHTPVLYQNEES